MIIIETVKEATELLTYIPEEIYLYDTTKNIDDTVYIEGDYNQINATWDKFIEEYGAYEVNGIEVDIHEDELRLKIAEKKEEEEE